MKHIFISYIRDDQDYIDKICAFIEYNEIPYWLDRKDILPGKDWKMSIRDAIESGSLFFAFFSSNYFSRKVTYMNEELNLAIECLRKRPQNSSWFIPVRLEKCNIPEISIGGGRTLSDIQSLDFFEDFEVGKEHLLDVIKANNIPFNKEKSEDNVPYELEMRYLSLKALIDNSAGHYFHNADMGHPVYVAGALGKVDGPWEYADGPAKNKLFKRLKEASGKLKNSGYPVEEYTWWYDFTSWQSFCQYVVNTYRRTRGYKEL